MDYNQFVDDAFLEMHASVHRIATHRKGTRLARVNDGKYTERERERERERD